MPIQHAIWKVGEKPTPLSTSCLATEQKLEELIASNLRILSSDDVLKVFENPQNMRERAEGQE
jgi:hypothetical protein